ncbi:MAG: MBL fold metallo-hydrolase, partial [Proteobacteria bacterium]|nr:MBL fold metallo-hydrolase [Pseudomonadota bacterium]
DAAYANRKGFARHFPALPLYDKKDAADALDRLRPVPWAIPHAIGGFKLSFHRVGHILGASCARLEDADTSVLFSGDVGRSTDLLMRPSGPPPAAEFVVLESTYGARSHSEEGLVARLAEVVRETVSRGGVLLIPAFAVGRSQAVLWALHRLQQDGEIPNVPLLLDSPMATNTTELYQEHARELRVPPSAIDGMCASVRDADRRARPPPPGAAGAEPRQHHPDRRLPGPRNARGPPARGRGDRAPSRA